jgi:hypothetical protein
MTFSVLVVCDLIVEVGGRHSTQACDPVTSLYSDRQALLKIVRFFGIAGVS